jgi:hypothetical protein
MREVFSLLFVLGHVKCDDENSDVQIDLPYQKLARALFTTGYQKDVIPLNVT